MDIAKAEGARCILGGGPATASDLPGGQFVEPTIFVDVDPNMRIAREEVFGPVLAIMGFDEEADAIKMANDTIYGLAAGVWTSDIGRAMRMSRSMMFGTVWVNNHIPIISEMPHGGFKNSGYGKDMSRYAIEEYTELKHVMIKH
jgi:aldehyde dehydrogenase (NAD+)